VHQLSPDTRPLDGGTGRSRPAQHRRRRSGKLRRPAVVVAALLGVGLAGAGLAAVSFLGAGSGHSVAAETVVPHASSASPKDESEQDATAQPEPVGKPAFAVLPTPSASAKPASRPVPTSSAKANSGTSSPVGGTVTVGDSKAHCIALDFPGGVLNQSTISAASSVTGVTYNCLSTFANPMPTWPDWETPWMFSTVSDGWDAWLATDPPHQVVMSMDLIPQSVSNTSDPLAWEQPCADGSYDQDATTLARNLVSYGAGSIVIRLGTEANGNWEADYVGTTSTEMSDWAKCYDNEVSAMRGVAGAHFLFVWNPNVCTSDLPINDWYPGNAYVDIIGIDVYDQDCQTLKTVAQEGWTAYSTDGASPGASSSDFPSLANMEAFATANGKPLSFPEWGLNDGDDASYVTDMGQMFTSDNFSFESYFDTNDDGIAPLGSSSPSATAAYPRAFG
jgi:hypothetical protein